MGMKLNVLEVIVYWMATAISLRLADRTIHREFADMVIHWEFAEGVMDLELTEAEKHYISLVISSWTSRILRVQFE